jgi:riboflavin synthase
VFTGIVEAAASVRRLERSGTGARLVVPRPRPGWELATGDSVAVSGCCLTVAELAGDDVAFDLSAETLARTTLGELAPGARVNLERAARLSDRLGGHLVSGHVDGVGRVLEVAAAGDGGREVRFEVPATLERYLIEKGSITLDGVSLTVVEPRGATFRVALIPETLRRTTLGDARTGTRVNVEADLVGKWIEKLVGSAR